MSRHEGVSCDSCNKNNFRGKRFKCLVCYDYDLCAQCHDSGAATTRHSKDHPMQCILTRTDFELYYGGEALTVDQPQSFCCPFCGKLGLTESGLPEHVSAEHPETSSEVVCPVCAALPRGDPNHVTDDFMAHLTMEHRTLQSGRDFDEPTGSRVRRILHGGRSLGQARARRVTNQSFGNSTTSTTPQFNSGSPAAAARDTIDPIAELLSQLSGVRRTAQQSQQSVQSQLQLLQQQLQFERQQVQQTRERLERLPRRPLNSGVATATPASRQENSSTSNSGFLLARCCENELSEEEQVELEVRRANRSLFVQDLLVSTLETVSNTEYGDSEDIEETENCLDAATVSDPPEGESGTEEGRETLERDMELINLEDEKES